MHVFSWRTDRRASRTTNHQSQLCTAPSSLTFSLSLQALLTIMTSQTIEIHQRSVLQIIKTCFNIYLTSRSKINEATAQGCLAQMLNGIFAKMEQKMVRPAWNRLDGRTHCVCSRHSSANDESNLKRTRLAKARTPSMPNIFPQVKNAFSTV